MRAYQNIKLTECPDVQDIQSEGRRSAVGRIRRGESYRHYGRGRNAIVDNAAIKVKRNDRGYCNPRRKAATRRYLKRVDRAMSIRLENESE